VPQLEQVVDEVEAYPEEVDRDRDDHERGDDAAEGHARGEAAGRAFRGGFAHQAGYKGASTFKCCRSARLGPWGRLFLPRDFGLLAMPISVTAVIGG